MFCFFNKETQGNIKVTRDSIKQFKGYIPFAIFNIT